MARQSLVRTFVVLAVYAGLTGVDAALFVASTRQLVAAYDERAQVERISVHLHGLFANCKDH